MLYIETNSTKPYVNLAYEEYFLKRLDINENILMLWQNEPTIVVGQFQNTHEEINSQFTNQNNIHVIRRITGGGAVYHDFGNLCYTFILNDIKPDDIDFSIFALPVVNALEKFGISAKVSGRNDLTINDMKFSGTAMSLYKNKLLFHGTILYDSDISVIQNALNVDPSKFKSKSAKSVKSRVTNIKPFLKENISINDFKKSLKCEIGKNKNLIDYELNKDESEKIKSLSIQKYQNTDWIFGKNPKAEIITKKRFEKGSICFYINLKENKVYDCSIKGDFLGLRDISLVETILIGQQFDRLSFSKSLSKINTMEYFGGISQEEILDCIFQ